MNKRKLLTSMLALLLLATSMLASQPKAHSESVAPKKITFEKIWSISEKQMGWASAVGVWGLRNYV